MARFSKQESHWHLWTPLTLQGRGIIHLQTATAETLAPCAEHQVGWHQYRLTDKAFESICSQHRAAVERLLSLSGSLARGTRHV